MDLISIKGIIPPMLTPFKQNGDVDYGGHVSNLEKWNEDGLCGYLVLGSNSETAYLNEQEKLKLMELTVKHARADRIILAGTGMESARDTTALTNKAADLGVHAALILTPSYYHTQMKDDALIAFFTEVADNAKIPILLYNVPAFTHINISANAVEILSRHPNIIGMKDSTGNIPQMVNFQRVMSSQFHLIVGTLSAWYPALCLGIQAGIFASANFAPNECAEIQHTFGQRNSEISENTYRRIFPVNTAVTATFGIAGLKYAADLLGYTGGHVRNPLLPLKSSQKRELHEILSTAGLL